MTMFIDIDHCRASPRKQEVPTPRSQRDGEAEVDVVGHEDEHEEVADDDLDDVKEGLQAVRQRQHRTATRKNENSVCYMLCNEP